MNMYDLMKSSIRSLKSNKMRTFLTMLGIIIGISSVISMSAIGKGGQKSIVGDLQSTGYGNFQIVVNTSSDDYVSAYDLDIKSIEKIKQIDNVAYVSPELTNRGELKFPDYPDKTERAFISVTTKDYEEIDKLNYTYGRPFLDSEYESKDRIAVIDDETAKDYYGSQEASIGKLIEVKIGGKESKSYKYKILGIFKNPYIGITSLFGAGFKPRVVRIPLETYMADNGLDTYQMLLAKVKEPQKLNETITEVQEMLDLESKPRVYEVSPANSGDSFNNILTTLNLFITFVSGISLLVGGIGVMNIMLVSVTERIREIGIRKAIGAQPRSIMLQFLVESVIISLLGGIIGLITGISFAYVVFLVTGIEPVFSIGSILFAMIVSIMIGIIFGVTPARRAAKLNPVDALRA